jgi:PhnB protein
VHISPHLQFDGQCRFAFEAYHRLFGGTLTTMLSYGESPMATDVEPQWHDRIVHATLRVGDFELAGADVLPSDYRKPQGFSVILVVDEIAEAERLFSALADGGAVQLPLQPTFWSPGFAVLVDRFGVPWEISTAAAQSAP